MENTILVTCPHCRKQMRMKNPMKPGSYRIACPFCNTPFLVKIIGGAAAGAEKPAAADDAAALVQDCTGCGMKLRIRNPLPGKHTFLCPHCKSEQSYAFSPENGAEKEPDKPVHTPTKVVPKGFSLSNGCLVQQRGRFMPNRRFVLNGAVTTVGREDEQLPSDISIKNDTAMSRRSVCITAESKPQGFLYKLTVLNATNRVLHNGCALSKGDSVYLSFGDSIVLGKTTFTFEKLS